MCEHENKKLKKISQRNIWNVTNIGMHVYIHTHFSHPPPLSKHTVLFTLQLQTSYDFPLDFWIHKFSQLLHRVMTWGICLNVI